MRGRNGNGKKTNGSNGNGNHRDYNKEALDLWTRLEKPIGQFISRIIGFNSFMSYEDYLNEAFIACLQAVKKYNSEYQRAKEEYIPGDMLESAGQRYMKSFSVNGKSSMKLEVFACWLIQKHLYRKADQGEVVFHVFDDNGNYCNTVSNGAYRKRKQKLQQNGYRAVSSKIVTNLGDMTIDNEKNNEIEIADNTLMGFNEDVIESFNKSWQ